MSRRGRAAAIEAKAPMATEIEVGSSSGFADLLGAEQVATTFRNVGVGVVGAAVSAAALAAIVIRLKASPEVPALAWAAFVTACALVHLSLLWAYRRAQDTRTRWRRWGSAFTAVSLAEGTAWGWATVLLVRNGDAALEMMTMVVCLSIATGAIPVFSPYLPAFNALFFPTTAPFALVNIVSGRPLLQGGALLMLLFIVFMEAIALRTNRNFRDLVLLRLRTDRLAEDLRRQKEIAEEANLAKSRFLAAASHDLRQPVHALSLFTGALRQIEAPPAALRLIDEIEASAAAMDSLFEAILDISRLDAGVVEVRRLAFPLQPLLARACRDQAGEAQGKGLRLRLRPCDVHVASDPTLLERIVRNLVANAVRYSERGGVLVACRRRGASVRIEVWDTGRGIAEADRDRIFEEFFQLENPERDRMKGLGLGLAIVRRLAGLLGSPVVLRSRPGRGSCFSLDVPLATEGEIRAAPAAEPSAGALARGLVVVIDDERPIREAMGALLIGWGYEVVVAASGDEAMALLAACPQRPDVIVCDYRLRGGETGIEVIARLQAEYNAAIPAMLVTGDTAPDRLVEARGSGLLLLHKPVSNGKLRAALVNLRASAQAPPQIAL